MPFKSKNLATCRFNWGSWPGIRCPSPLGVCAVQRRRFPVGANPIRQSLQPEAIGAVMEVTKWLKPSISVSRIGDSASVQAATRVNAEQASKRTMRRPTRQPFRGRLIRLDETSKGYVQTLRRGSGGGMYTRKAYATREARAVAMSALPSTADITAFACDVRKVPIPDMRTTSRRRAPIRLIGTDEARIPHHSKNTSDAPSFRHARYPERFRISLDVLGSTKVLPPL
jgi:hypothetical protein